MDQLLSISKTDKVEVLDTKEKPQLRIADGRFTSGCGSKLNRGGYAGLVHVSIYQGSILVPVF